jgi:hypothetical protein
MSFGNKGNIANLKPCKPGETHNPAGVPKSTLERRKALGSLYDMSVDQLKATLLSSDAKPGDKDRVAMYVVDQVVGKAKNEIDLKTEVMPKEELVEKLFSILSEQEAHKPAEEKN